MSSRPTPQQQAPAPGQGTSLAATKAAATGLWVLVGAGLAYGVSQTLLRVVQLFG